MFKVDECPPCPYCGAETVSSCYLDEDGHYIKCECYADEGGCGKKYYAKARLSYQIESITIDEYEKKEYGRVLEEWERDEWENEW